MGKLNIQHCKWLVIHSYQYIPTLKLKILYFLAKSKITTKHQAVFQFSNHIITHRVPDYYNQHLMAKLNIRHCKWLVIHAYQYIPTYKLKILIFITKSTITTKCQAVLQFSNRNYYPSSLHILKSTVNRKTYYSTL